LSSSLPSDRDGPPEWAQFGRTKKIATPNVRRLLCFRQADLRILKKKVGKKKFGVLANKYLRPLSA
jgi:hypothetical protein